MCFILFIKHAFFNIARSICHNKSGNLYHVYRRLILSILLITIVGFLVFLKNNGILLDDLQTVFFPAILLIAFGLSGITLTLSTSAIFFILFFAPLTAALNIRGFLPYSPSYRGGIMSNLQNAGPALDTRSFNFKINEVNDLNESPRIGMIHRVFTSSAQGQNWLARHSSSRFLIWGNSNWPNIEIQDFSTISSGIRNRIFVSDSTRCRFPNNRHVATIALKTPAPLELCFVPTVERFTVPLGKLTPHDLELGRHFIAFLNEGLYRLSMPVNHIPENYRSEPTAWVILPFTQAAQLRGNWAGNSAISAASLFVANMEFIGALISDSPSPAQLNCALENYRIATARVANSYFPEILSATFNNAALALLVKAENDVDFEKVNSWLIRASAMTLTDGNKPAGALAATENLHYLRANGLL